MSSFFVIMQIALVFKPMKICKVTWLHLCISFKKERMQIHKRILQEYNVTISGGQAQQFNV